MEYTIASTPKQALVAIPHIIPQHLHTALRVKAGRSRNGSNPTTLSIYVSWLSSIVLTAASEDASYVEDPPLGIIGT